MKMNNCIAYAHSFASFLLEKINAELINKIVLFGSTAKGDATKESDIDIFVELKKKNKKLEAKIRRLSEEFYKTPSALLFRTRGIDNVINTIAGRLDDWPDLRKSIEGTGILLYGYYIAVGLSGKKHILISWDKIGKNRGAFLNKLYGFTAKGKHYKGLIEELNGKKIGKSSIMMPIETHKEIIVLLKHYKVNAEAIEVWYEG